MMKAQKMPPTFYPVNSPAGQNQYRQCDICGKLQKISEGFNVAAELCGDCVKGFSEPITEAGGVACAVRPSWWTRFKDWPGWRD